MNFFLVFGLCSGAVAVFVLRLLADGKKLERRLMERRMEFRELPSEEEVPLIKDDYATWMAPPF